MSELKQGAPVAWISEVGVGRIETPGATISMEYGQGAMVPWVHWTKDGEETMYNCALLEAVGLVCGAGP